MSIKLDGTLIGYRVTDEGEVAFEQAGLLQVSIYKGWPRAIDRMLATITACRRAAIPYVVHPIDFFLSDVDLRRRADTMDQVKIMARNADLALIIHDEAMRNGQRIAGEREAAYREAVRELSSICNVSIENSANSHDIKWFWDTYANSVTLDIGHLEAAGIDSSAFIDEAHDRLLKKLDFVHIHRVAGLRKGIIDHWGLEEGCRELKTLRRLLGIKKNIGIIVEVIDNSDIEKSLGLVKKIVTAA